MKKPFSVTFVSVCQIFLSLVTGFLALMYFVYGFYGILHLNWSRVLSSMGTALVLGAIAFGAFSISNAFSDGQRWAWKASFGLGLLTAFPGVYCFASEFWQHNPSGEGWGFALGIIFLAPVAVVWIVFLLPSTHKFFKAHRRQQLNKRS